MEIMSEATVKNIRNILAFAKDMEFKNLDGVRAIGFANSYKYLFDLANEIEDEMKEEFEPAIKE